MEWKFLGIDKLLPRDHIQDYSTEYIIARNGNEIQQINSLEVDTTVGTEIQRGAN
jgi:hypothetical protein